MELGKKIRQLRGKAGLTQEQLSARLGVGAQAVSKWETAVAMPDITTLPLLAETFGVSIDELFDLTTEQRFNRIENRMDLEEELPQDVFWEYEEFLKEQLADARHKKRATELIAQLYWHRMNSCAQKAARYAREAVRMAPAEKGCQWILSEAEHHAVWDWNFANHRNAIEFYRELVEQNPDCVMPRYYLIDNLLADRRADEAEQNVAVLSGLDGANPALLEAYRAEIALLRYDERTADQIMERLTEERPDNPDCLFEAAQYYAKKCNYEKAIALYTRAFEQDRKCPRYIDAPMAIADLYEIMGDYQKAAEACDRIIDVQKNEWGMTEEVELQASQQRKARLLQKAQQ